jgi:NAD(P)-dependent dehydrogenase (short-subunit alcohol dehydrogenase family)
MGSYLVAGGTGGIGAAVARRLAARGDRVTITGRTLEKTQAIAADIGCGAAALDANDETSIAAAIAAASVDGALIGVVWAVGSIPLKPLKAASAQDFAAAYALNVIGAAMLVKAGAAALAKGAGSVVLFSSIAAGQGFANHAIIGSAKAAVEGLARSLAAELAPAIRVNCIAPSLTKTPLAAALTANEPMAKAIAAMHPLPRLGEADDIAALAAFLLSDESSWMTGQIIGVDGGRSTLRVKG